MRDFIILAFFAWCLAAFGMWSAFSQMQHTEGRQLEFNLPDPTDVIKKFKDDIHKRNTLLLEWKVARMLEVLAEKKHKAPLDLIYGPTWKELPKSERAALEQKLLETFDDRWFDMMTKNWLKKERP